jgi:manganese efflux pump family protein
VDALTIVLIAIGLAMDAFAVSIANGMTINSDRRKSALLTAVFFGGFQMLMPAIGWAAGLTLQGAIADIDHWVAFALLAFIGAKMIHDGIKKDDKQDCSTDLKLHTLLILAIATSIDALMVGFSFAFLQISILEPLIVIGAVTFVLSFVGFYFGCGLGKRFGHRIEIVGGVVLVIIGLRILLEHLLA